MNKQVKHILANAETSDSGNATCLDVLYGNTLRFCHKWGKPGKWLVWKGAYWQPDENGEASRAMRDVAHARKKAATDVDDHDKSKKLFNWALGSANSSKIKAGLEAASYHETFTTTLDQYDANPMLAATNTITLDLVTGNHRKAQREDYITRCIGATYDTSANCPRWKQFLEEVFEDDHDLINYLQRAVGYSLTGDIREQKLFLCYGDGANGKSTFLDVLTWLLGDYAATAAFSTFDAKKNNDNSNDLAMLKAARLVTISESNEDRRLDEGRIKIATGGDPITCRFLHQEFFTYTPQFKIWFAMNHKPIIRGTDNGIWRRIALIPFNASFLGKEDKTLKTTLKNELSGILNWALEGLQEWRTHGLGRCRAVDEATQAYREEQDALGAFIQSECITQSHCRVGATELYQAYTTWCDTNGEYACNQRKFGTQMTSRGFDKTRGGKNGNLVYIGIGLIGGCGEKPEHHSCTDNELMELNSRNEFSGFFAKENSHVDLPEIHSNHSVNSVDEPVSLPIQRSHIEVVAARELTHELWYTPLNILLDRLQPDANVEADIDKIIFRCRKFVKPDRKTDRKHLQTIQDNLHAAIQFIKTPPSETDINAYRAAKSEYKSVLTAIQSIEDTELRLQQAHRVACALGYVRDETELVAAFCAWDEEKTRLEQGI